MSNRGKFASQTGIILATAGSAVGLGNVWRFPYMAGANGGAAFIILYFACILLLGIPGMVSEFIIGRHAQRNSYRAYRLMGGNLWCFVGILGIITSTIILGFYAVVAGWCLQYLYASIAGLLNGDAHHVQQYFTEFSASPVRPCLWAVTFILLTHLVIARGVQRGIERASKILMPLLLFLLVVIVVASCMLPGAMGGIKFLLYPDFSKVSSSMLLEALGQAFFSLSLGTACLCTYASYFSRRTHLPGAATQIALIDTIIAILAGLMIFPAAFSVGINPDSGPSLIFITLPNVFQQAFSSMPVLGYVISLLFYLLLVFAALTSTISMHEIGTAFFHEELHLQRRSAVWILTVVCSLIAIGCSLSMGAVPNLKVMDMPLLDFCDRLTAQIMLPAGAILTSILVGWFVNKRVLYKEFTNNGTIYRALFPIWHFCVRIIVPLCILSIFLHQFGLL
jgi:NSS family neurotransmitter:Na+ symporter